MKKTHHTKKNWHGWIDADVLEKVKSIAKEKGIPTNIYVEEILRKEVEGK